MTLEFVKGYDYDNPVLLKVKTRPTEEQYKKIDDFISLKLERAEANDIDIDRERFWDICYYAVDNTVGVVFDETIKTFYY